MVILALWALLAEAPLYTNDDLERVAPYRDETGVFSVPRTEAASAERRERPAGKPRTTRGETYWRQQAERTRDRMRVLRDRQDALRDRIADRERQPGTSRLRDPRIQSWEKAVAALELRIREEDLRLEERARREGALPGWLR